MTRSWLWAGTIVLAVLGAAFGFQETPGINWTIWTSLAGAGLVIAVSHAPQARGRSTSGVLGSVILAALLSLCAAITTNYVIIGFVFIGVVVLLAVASLLATGQPLADLGPAVIAVSPLIALWRAVIEAGARIGEVVRSWRGERAGPVARGVLIAVPIVCVFALLLSGADPVLAAWREAVFRMLRNIEALSRIVFGVALGVCVLGAYGGALRGSRGEEALPVDRGGQLPMFHLGGVERGVVLWSVIGIFGLYLVLQLSSLFMDAAHVAAGGMSYASYVHRGVGQLTFAGTGCVVLLVLLEWAQGGETRGRAAWEWIGALVLVAEVVCVLASAYHRVLLYEAAYGYTVWRAVVELYLLAVALLLVLLAWELWQSHAVDDLRFARRAGVVAVAAIVALTLANVDGLVAERNIARYQATGKLDANYLSRTEWDGLPEALKVLPLVPPDCALSLKWRLFGSNQWRYYRTGFRPWYSWVYRSARSAAAYREAGLDRLTQTVTKAPPMLCPGDSTARPLQGAPE